MFKIESIVKKIFSLFGMEIRWISPRCSAAHIIIKDPVQQNSLETLNDFYSNPEIVKEYLEPDRIAFYHEVISILRNHGIKFERKQLADVGCGTGHLLKFISETENVASLTGFEYSDAALKIAKETCPKANFIKYDIYGGSLQKFDIVFCTEVLEHLLYPDKALENVLNMIADNGTLLITVPNGRTDSFLGHINFWSPESWRVFIETYCEVFDYDIGLTKTSDTNYAIIQLKTGCETN